MNHDVSVPVYSKGFTLLEILMVIAIIGILSGVVIGNVRSGVSGALASRTATELREIERAWRIWQIDTGYNFRNEDIYGTSYGTGPERSCTDEVPIDETELYSDTESTPGWNGPYIAADMPGPFGLPYAYDFDDDSVASDTSGGVNIFLPWCTAEYQSDYENLAVALDAIFDDSDGASSGKLRWSGGAQGQIMYLVYDNN